MDLSPEDKRKIYEEEKAKIESNSKKLNLLNRVLPGKSTVNLEPNVAALLCYVGFSDIRDHIPGS